MLKLLLKLANSSHCSCNYLQIVTDGITSQTDFSTNLTMHHIHKLPQQRTVEKHETEGCGQLDHNIQHLNTEITLQENPLIVIIFPQL